IVVLVPVLNVSCGGVGEEDPDPLLDGTEPRPGEVVGTGVLEAAYGSPRLEVDARGGRDDAEGRFSIEYPGLAGHPRGRLSGPVNCVYVNANEAFLIGQLEQADIEDPQNRFKAGEFIVIGVLDLGDPSAAGAEPDRANFSRTFATKPICGRNPTAIPDALRAEGDFSVKEQ
ncbi:MAG: hypothetical protein L0Y64_00300, partial [Myxococcaceae bacterium]|nr:hypothetical protein [Myxococcaceae bacterium]